MVISANRVSKSDMPTKVAVTPPDRALGFAFVALLLGFVLQAGDIGALYAGLPTAAEPLAIVALAFVGVAAIALFRARKTNIGHRAAENDDVVHARNEHGEMGRNPLPVEDLPEKSNSDHEAARIRAALDACKTNVMVADESYNIIYMNGTMTEMMRAAEADLRKDIPVLSADKLIGASIDTFHKNPAHQRGILERLDKTIETDIKIGGHDFHLIVTPVFGGGKERIGTVVEWQDQTDIKAAEQVAFRLKSALDGCKTNVMVADDAYNIVYMNDTMLEMMRAAEADMRRDLPSLDVNKLIGTNIDTFHKNPAHQRRILDSLKSVTETDIKVGGRSFHLVVSPIVDKAGKRLGTTVEWKDETAEKVIEVEINNVVEAAVAGDLTQRVSPDGKTGFMLNLANSMNTLCGKVAEFVGGIKGAAQEVTNASAEISTSTTDLSQRTEEQAASLEETTASMEEIGATVKKNAENAQQANSSAINTREVADRGGEVVAKAVDAMARIEDSSGKISDIIGVIDEIARQTNLLALNAAVEAARAGDAGRGFAVVASEVRSLAQRSSQAAKDIKDLITNSGTQVKDGVELVNRAGAALTEIVESIKDVASIVSEIASASAEQATGIEQVNKALEQMDEVTQQNSALVEENAATAKTLEQQAMAMNEQVAFFRLGDEMGQSAVRANAVGTVSAKPRQAVPSVQKQAVKPKVVESPAGQQSASKQRGGPARRMQTNLAAAFQGDPQWKDF